MKQAAKTDRNQAEIVTALRGLGVSVQTLHAVGKGCPDLLCGFRSENFLLEVKDGAKPPSARNLTPAQQTFHSTWRGQVAVVSSVAEAMRAVGIF